MKKIILALLAIGALGTLAYYASTSNTNVAPAAMTVSAEAPTPAAPTPPAINKEANAPQPAAPVTRSQPIPAPVMETRQVAPPMPAIAPAPTPAADQPEAPSPRAELATAIPELARLMGTQDYETLMQDFMPPEELDAMLADLGQPGQPMTLTDLADRMRQNPTMTQKMASASQFMVYLQTQTPTFDETGENASYKMPVVINGMDSINFVKVDGNWYVKNGRQFFR
jgi:hypothetical protein